MQLETLKNVSVIDGFKVTDNYLTADPEEFPILVNLDANAIAFKWQYGTVSENGVNGCQVDTLIEVAKLIIIGLNNNLPSQHNRDAIQGLNSALYALKEIKN